MIRSCSKEFAFFGRSFSAFRTSLKLVYTTSVDISFGIGLLFSKTSVDCFSRVFRDS